MALLAAVYVAAEIVLPLVLAVVISLLLQPAMRLLERWHVPRLLAALLLMLAVFGTIVGLGAAIAGPASTWAGKLPGAIPRLQERLSFLQEPINTLQRFLQQVESYGQPAGGPAVSAEGSTLITKLFTGTRHFASGLFTTILFLFFLLVSGDTFLRRLLEILPSFSDKRQAVDIFQQVESDISAYLVTITRVLLEKTRAGPREILEAREAGQAIKSWGQQSRPTAVRSGPPGAPSLEPRA